MPTVMILHILTLALTKLMVCTAAHSQQSCTLNRCLAVSRVNNLFRKPASFNVPIAQSNIVSTGSELAPARNKAIIFITSKSIENEF